jgi:hypothetical protein
MIIGGIILLWHLNLHFTRKDIKNIFKSNSQFVIGNTKKKYENFKSYIDADDTLFIMKLISQKRNKSSAL